MILLAALLAAQTAPPPTVSDETVVTGRRMARLKRLRMTTKRDRATGVTQCVFKRRSGDPALDAAVCDVVLACVPKVGAIDEMRACVAPTLDMLVPKDVPWRAEATGESRQAKRPHAFQRCPTTPVFFTMTSCPPSPSLASMPESIGRRSGKKSDSV